MAAIRPPWRSTIHEAIANPRPVPPLRRAGRPIEAVEHPRQVLGLDARALVLDDEDCVAAVGPDEDVDAAASRGMADRVVDEDADELAQPRRVAGHLGGHGVDDQLDVPLGGEAA